MPHARREINAEETLLGERGRLDVFADAMQGAIVSVVPEAVANLRRERAVSEMLFHVCFTGNLI